MSGRRLRATRFWEQSPSGLLKQCIGEGIVEARLDSRLIPTSYYSIWAAIHRVSRRLRLDSQIQTCHGFRKYFENALDDANIDHEKKMIIEGHFAGTRAKHYTDRNVEELRDIYRRAYPFIRISVDEPVQIMGDSEIYRQRLSDLETQFHRQHVLEARLTVFEDELNQMKQFRKRMEQQTAP